MALDTLVVVTHILDPIMVRKFNTFSFDTVPTQHGVVYGLIARTRCGKE